MQNHKTYEEKREIQAPVASKEGKPRTKTKHHTKPTKQTNNHKRTNIQWNTQVCTNNNCSASFSIRCLYINLAILMMVRWKKQMKCSNGSENSLREAREGESEREKAVDRRIGNSTSPEAGPFLACSPLLPHAAFKMICTSGERTCFRFYRMAQFTNQVLWNVSGENGANARA